MIKEVLSLCMTRIPFGLFSICSYINFVFSSVRFVNVQCYLIGWKCLTFLETVLPMHVDLIFQLFWKNVQVSCMIWSSVNLNMIFFVSSLCPFCVYMVSYVAMKNVCLKFKLRYTYAIMVAWMWLYIESCCRYFLNYIYGRSVL